jgi:hypothetical protein
VTVDDPRVHDRPLLGGEVEHTRVDRPVVQRDHDDPPVGELVGVRVVVELALRGDRQGVKVPVIGS